MMQSKDLEPFRYCFSIESVIDQILGFPCICALEMVLIIHHNAQSYGGQINVNPAETTPEAMKFVIYKHVRGTYSKARWQSIHCPISSALINTWLYCILGSVEDLARFAVQGGSPQAVEVVQQGLGGDECCVAATELGEVALDGLSAADDIERHVRVFVSSPKQ